MKRETIIPIPRNEGGTLAVLYHMAAIARASAPIVDFLAYAIDGGLPKLDAMLRMNWNYVFKPLPDMQELVVPDALMEELANTGRMTGACAEAATMAAALALHFPTRSISICAVRPPRSMHFEHVFTVIDAGDGSFRVDPTAPPIADYTRWETMCVPVRRS
jgi:hypothetical protein